MIKGRQSIVFDKPVYVESAVSVVGKKESEGPLRDYYDVIVEDAMAGENTWEEAESRLQELATDRLFAKSSIEKDDVRYLFGGDLLGQLIATSFGVSKHQIPLFGLYGACSTFGEALSLGAMSVSGGFADNVVALASSHFASAEKQFRFPLEYGNQRPLASTWTVTGCGAVMLTAKECLSCGVSVNAVTTGRIVDYGVKDSMNMGACMAPAAADLLAANFKDLDVDETYYDRIITGDLGSVGRDILIELMKEKGYNITNRYMDCGIEIYDQKTQDTKAGGSGCGCSAAVFSGYILEKLRNGEWKRILFVPTGALLSTVSFNEGRSVPGIAHGVVFESC